MRVLDLCCGLGGATRAFEERGHDVIGVDNTPEFEPDICRDIFDIRISELRDLGPFDFIWASPPCKPFTVMAISKNWESEGGPHPGIMPSTSGKHHRPKRGACYRGIALVEWVVEIIRQLKPRAFVIENPRGMMRNLEVMHQFERRTVTYCQYGLPFMKPTDLWGGFPGNLKLRAPCKAGDQCHQRARRGADVGVQGVHDPARDVVRRLVDGRPLEPESFQGREYMVEAFAELNEERGGRGAWDKDAPPRTEGLEQDQLAGPGSGASSSAPAHDLRLDLLRVPIETVPRELRNPALRSLVPYELSAQVCMAMEEWDGKRVEANPRTLDQWA